jgi:AcrR family transcriptional regulator
MDRRPGAALRATRRARGTPEETRERLVAAAALVFNRDGYYGTDSNKIAAEAGYAAGTFYKHFADKRAILLAAHERWVTAEWAAIETELASHGERGDLNRRIVELVLDLHVRWKGLRASLLALLPVDAEVRRFHRAQRRRQLEMLAATRERRGARPRSRETDAVGMLALERVCDAIAQGEAKDLGLDRERLVDRLLEVLRSS